MRVPRGLAGGWSTQGLQRLLPDRSVRIECHEMLLERGMPELVQRADLPQHLPMVCVP
ncbi:hypothetical protein NOCA2150116 [metagenome]|uniref:Uncharacterized protein n=1 Tax=metagenome TaxID=256318 RepID=A0A2P2BXA7_9ZZZZ